MPLNPTQTNGRQNVGRIDHVVFVYHNRQNQEKARQEFSDMLDIDDWDDMGEVYGRVHVVVSWKSGIELIYPTQPDAAFDHHLATRGEGLFSLVFGVADLDHAMAHLASKGIATHEHPAAPEGVRRSFEVARETGVGSVGGINVTLGEFKPVKQVG